MIASIIAPGLPNLLDPKFLTDWIEALGKAPVTADPTQRAEGTRINQLRKV